MAGSGSTGGGGCTSSGTTQVERSSGGGGTAGRSVACSQPSRSSSRTRQDHRMRMDSSQKLWMERRCQRAKPDATAWTYAMLYSCLTNAATTPYTGGNVPSSPTITKTTVATATGRQWTCLSRHRQWITAQTPNHTTMATVVLPLSGPTALENVRTVL